ncbi:DUF1127 domain-containing protein [Shinella sp.]|uniref:DUF1127 domain-containing protein n=1 Tax=Shinella sp. TaxID=1870904 RepID=UPI00301BE4E4
MAIDTFYADAKGRARNSLRAIPGRAWRACWAWHIKRHTRYALLELTDEQLRDVGLTRSEARREAGKSYYWD